MSNFKDVPAINEKDGTFTILARKCQRCGGILTSKIAIENGLGHTCKTKQEEENKSKDLDGQMNFFNEI